MIPRYSDSYIENIYSDISRYQLYCDLEIAIYNSMNISDKKLSMFNLTHHQDVERIKEIEKTTKHELASVVDFLIEKTGVEQIHLGLTSSDILDTAYCFMLHKTFQYIIPKMHNIYYSLVQLSGKYKDTIMCGRTHGKVAELIYLGKKIEKYQRILFPFIYDLETDVINTLPQIKISGPVGTNKGMSHINLSIAAGNIKDDVFNFLIDEPVFIYNVQSQIIDRNILLPMFMKYISFFICIESLVLELRILSQSGIEEFSEIREDEQKGSSSMPHKINPIKLENTHGLIQVMKSYIQALIATSNLWNERDMSHSSIERIIVPDMFHCGVQILNNMSEILSKGTFNVQNINQNIEKHSKEWKSSYVLNDLIKNHGYTRQRAYDAVKEGGIICTNYAHITSKDIMK